MGVARVVYGRFELARSLPATILVSVFIQFVNLGSGVVLARALGPSSRGDLAIAILWPTLIAGVGGLGIAEAITYYTGRNSDRSGEVLSSALLVGIVQSVILLAAGWLMVPYLLAGKPQGVLDVTRLYLWIIPLFPLTLYPLAVLQGRLLVGRFNLARASIHVLYTVALLTLWGVHAVTVHGALEASLLATLLTFVLTFWLVATRIHIRLVSISVVRSLLTYGAKLHLGNVAALVAQRVDLLALTFLASSAVLGNYVVASAMGAAAALIPSAVSTVLFPLFSKRDSDAVPHGVARFMLLAGAVTVIAGPILALVLPSILPYLFGPAFAAARTTAMILVLAYLFRGWNQMLSSILRGTGRPIVASVGELGGLVIMTAFLVALVPGSGAYGAAIAVLIGACSMFAWVGFQTLRGSRLTTRRLLAFWSADFTALRHLIRHPHLHLPRA
jgi:O-antigen/teichoic acid export membrane protein